MGTLVSSMGKGIAEPSTQMANFVIGVLYKQFSEREIDNFDDFHVAILDIFCTFNSALPGKHHEVPSRKEVEKWFGEWKEASEGKKEVFVSIMKRKIHLSQLDDSTMVTGLVTPAAAMAAKRVGEKIGHMKIIKFVPDVVFVPSATVLALFSAKFTKKMVLQRFA